MALNHKYYIYKDKDEHDLVGVVLYLATAYMVTKKLVKEGSTQAHWKEV